MHPPDTVTEPVGSSSQHRASDNQGSQVAPAPEHSAAGSMHPPRAGDPVTETAGNGTQSSSQRRASDNQSSQAALAPVHTTAESTQPPRSEETATEPAFTEKAGISDRGASGIHSPPPFPPSQRRGSGGHGEEAFQSLRMSRMPEVDWIIPVERRGQKTAGDRLKPTRDIAEVEKNKYTLKARTTGYALNVAIGLQVLLGALVTALSAITSGRQTSIMTSILGGMTTLVASYLARARGSNEPELSITRVKDLEQFIRQCDIFILDKGHVQGPEHDDELNKLRERFEDLLGNADGKRRLATPV